MILPFTYKNATPENRLKPGYSDCPICKMGLIPTERQYVYVLMEVDGVRSWQLIDKRLYDKLVPPKQQHEETE